MVAFHLPGQEPARIHPERDSGEEPRLGPLDVVQLTQIEMRAALVKLAGHPSPAVSDAVTAVVREVLQRTRPGPA